MWLIISSEKKSCFACFIAEKITFTNAPSPQEFTEGDNANIVCDVVSSPPPTVIWKYKGAKIQMEKDGKNFVNIVICLVSLELVVSCYQLKNISS